MANSPKMIDDTAGKSSQMFESEAIASAIKMMEDYRIETRKEKKVNFSRVLFKIIMWSLFLGFFVYSLLITLADDLRRLKPIPFSSETCQRLFNKPKPLRNMSHVINEPGMSALRVEK